MTSVILKFYRYSQNKVSGRFDGETLYYIEAVSADHANLIAEKYTDIYFDGVKGARDCACCGDRWDRADEYDAYTSEDIASMGAGRVVVLYKEGR